MKVCEMCGEKLSGKQKKFCSKKCCCKTTNNKFLNYQSQQKRGNDRKKMLMELLGGNKCSVCGYDKNSSALHFHHIKPESKIFNIDIRQCSNRKLEILVEEARKCIVVCANCHSEIHHPELENNN